MHSRLTELLQKLPAPELSRIDKFVQSPYFNTHKHITRLWAFYRKYHPDFADNHFNDKGAFQYLFGKKQALDRRKLNRLNSELYKLIEQYICVRELESDRYITDDLLMNFFEKEGLSEHSLSLHQRLRKQLAQHPEGEQLYFRKLALEKSWSTYLAKRDKRTGDVNLQAYNEALDHHFLIQKLKILALMVNRRQVVHSDYDLSWAKETIAHAEEEKYKTNPTIQLYLCTLKMQQNSTDKRYYDQLKNLIEKWYESFPQDELRSFFAFLTNGVKYHFTTPKYTQELFDLYQKQLEMGVLHQNSKISHGAFRNVVSVGLDLKELEWVERFIDKNKNCISPESYQEEAYLLNLASLRYYQGAFDEAQQILAQLNPSDIYYKLLQRSLQCRLFYEQRELLFLAKFLASFSKYVHDQQEKIAEAKIASYRHFINYLNAFIKMIMESEKAWSAFDQGLPIREAEIMERLKDLIFKIEKESLFYNKKWLLDCIKRSL